MVLMLVNLAYLLHLFICIVTINPLQVPLLVVILRILDVLLVWEETTDSG